MNIAVIDKKDIILKLENNSIKIEEQTIPFKLIDILILNHRVTMSTNDILKLTKNNISILLISHNNENTSIISSANTKNADLKLAQYNSQSKKLDFAKYYISEKIKKHQEQLLNLGEDINIKDKLSQIEQAGNIDEIMGIEGSFARQYFSYYFNYLPKNMHKSKRSKKPPQDPVNALLSYWYSLYYNIITMKLLSYGYEPSLGYLHTPFRAHNALSSDLMEVFRAHINQAVYKVFENKILTIEDFSKKGGVYLKYEGRKKVWKEFIVLVDTLKPELDNQIATLKRMIYETNSNN